MKSITKTITAILRLRRVKNKDKKRKRLIYEARHRIRFEEFPDGRFNIVADDIPFGFEPQEISEVQRILAELREKFVRVKMMEE